MCVGAPLLLTEHKSLLHGPQPACPDSFSCLVCTACSLLAGAPLGGPWPGRTLSLQQLGLSPVRQESLVNRTHGPCCWHSDLHCGCIPGLPGVLFWCSAPYARPKPCLFPIMASCLLEAMSLGPLGGAWVMKMEPSWMGLVLL